MLHTSRLPSAADGEFIVARAEADFARDIHQFPHINDGETVIACGIHQRSDGAVVQSRSRENNAGSVAAGVCSHDFEGGGIRATIDCASVGDGDIRLAGVGDTHLNGGVARAIADVNGAAGVIGDSHKGCPRIIVSRHHIDASVTRAAIR